ncbi:hypothetical protein [Alkalicoccus halolimnae]|uniref:Uncharacterized protein n=1 Tax=Alkalicoccus halolimnae TaxID=1667239 RepID=A0A5C7F7L1_9BACI|nr:hypothetical protein [Alkalicoccus halolimnae]TXF85388.1 hypothetical protein FTX54_09410 [Alkalicoccus halolimnae]
MPLTVQVLIGILVIGTIIMIVTSFIPMPVRQPLPETEPEPEPKKNRKASSGKSKGEKKPGLFKTMFVSGIYQPFNRLAKKARYKKLQTEQRKTSLNTYEIRVYMLRDYKYAAESAKMMAKIRPIGKIVRADKYRDLMEVTASEIAMFERGETKK